MVQVHGLRVNTRRAETGAVQQALLAGDHAERLGALAPAHTVADPLAEVEHEEHREGAIHHQELGRETLQ
jgi:hypothetical protein